MKDSLEMFCQIIIRKSWYYLFYFFIIISSLSCKMFEEVPSESYHLGEKLYCIAHDGMKIRRTPSSKEKQYVDILKYKEVVKFIKIVKKIGVSKIPVNGKNACEYWLEVDVDNVSRFIHGAGLSNIEPDLFEELERQPMSASMESNVPGLYYIAKKDIDIQSYCSAESEVIGEIKKGTFLVFEGKRFCQNISFCGSNSNVWIKANNGWANGIYFLEFNKVQFNGLRQSFLDNNSNSVCYIATTNVKVRLRASKNSTKMGEIKMGEIVFPEKIKNGDSVSDCKLEDDNWLKVEDGWTSSLYFIPIYRNTIE